MPIYHVKTQFGENIVEANSRKQAIDFVLGSNASAEALSAVALSHVIRDTGLKIESALEPGEDDGQTDIEDIAA